ASRSHAARNRLPRCLRQGRWVLVDLDTRWCASRQSRLLYRAGRAGCVVSGPGALPRLGQVRWLVVEHGAADSSRVPFETLNRTVAVLADRVTPITGPPFSSSQHPSEPQEFLASPGATPSSWVRCHLR